MIQASLTNTSHPYQSIIGISKVESVSL